MKQRLLSMAVAACALISLSLLGSCSKDSSTTTEPSKAGTFTGDNLTFANGKARTWVKLNDAGNPTSLGVTVTEAALTGLTTDSMGTMVMLMLPSQAAMTVFDHVEFNWNPYGHPDPIYGAPHFDAHFYLSTMAEQEMIPGGIDTTKVDAKYVPANYIFGAPGDPAFSVPKMGVHYSDATGPEFNGQPFDKTFIYGYSTGKMVFMEPMITKAYLETHPSFNSDIKLPSAYQRTGKYYPTSYSVKYDATAKEYTISLEGLTMR